ncbi:hypothetical protein BT69DRAFT_200411 [Atractiella rhizophila]|nr:hypothetical protein BT69DRAFT_200411 [Atractiella rhizophila]
MPPKIIFTYYDCQYYGESCRDILRDSGVEHDDVRFESYAEFQEIKSDKTKFPFAKIPVLSYSKDGTSPPIILSESNAILHFLGEELGYVPNSLALGQSLMLVSALQDNLKGFLQSNDLDTMKAWFEGDLRAQLDQLEALTAHWNPDGTKYFFGTDKPVPGEFHFMELILHWKRFYSKVLDSHPKLTAMHAKILNRENIQKYLSGPDRCKRRSMREPKEGSVVPSIC